MTTTTITAEQHSDLIISAYKRGLRLGLIASLTTAILASVFILRLVSILKDEAKATNYYYQKYAQPQESFTLTLS